MRGSQEGGRLGGAAEEEEPQGVCERGVMELIKHQTCPRSRRPEPERHAHSQLITGSHGTGSSRFGILIQAFADI